MPEDIIKVKLGGIDHEAVRIQVHQSTELFNTYLLDDNSRIRAKLVLTDVLRLKDAFDAQGNPVYFLSHTMVTAVESPPELRRKEEP